MKTIKFLLVAILIFSAFGIFAQKGKGKHGHGHHHSPHKGKTVVVKHSHYHPNKVVVYHPYWHPTYSYNRRWVYFPRHNVYWDNWRNHYVFWHGGVWVSQPKAPAMIINVNLDKERNIELRDDEDDLDDIYRSNSDHKLRYKSD